VDTSKTYVLTIDEMLWQISKTSCKTVLSDLFDWVDMLIDESRCNFDDPEWELIHAAAKIKVDEFNHRVVH